MPDTFSAESRRPPSAHPPRVSAPPLGERWSLWAISAPDNLRVVSRAQQQASSWPREALPASSLQRRGSPPEQAKLISEPAPYVCCLSSHRNPTRYSRAPGEAACVWLSWVRAWQERRLEAGSQRELRPRIACAPSRSQA